MDKFALLKEMDEALEAANDCSKTLEQLLTKAREVGRPAPEMVEQISTVNKNCDELMQRYITAYRSYYNIRIV
jgi:uncharacterized protein Yka (UPF0111/DUF47 family)